jgi:hypothetical protein
MPQRENCYANGTSGKNDLPLDEYGAGCTVHVRAIPEKFGSVHPVWHGAQTMRYDRSGSQARMKAGTAFEGWRRLDKKGLTSGGGANERIDYAGAGCVRHAAARADRG